MSQTTTSPDPIVRAPILAQTVKFGERYVSSALNRKLAGIFGAGVYHGFNVRPSGVPGYVLIAHDPDYPKSVAVVERNGYSLTVSMADPGYVAIPSAGEWYIVLEAFYIETEPGYQYVVARKEEDLDYYHVVLAKVTVTDIEAEITASAIDYDVRLEADMKNLPADFERLQIMYVKELSRHARHVGQATKDMIAYLQAKNDLEVLFEVQKQRFQEHDLALQNELSQQRENYEKSMLRDAQLLTMHVKTTEQLTRDLESRKENEHAMSLELSLLRNTIEEYAERDTLFKVQQLICHVRHVRESLTEMLMRIELKNAIEEQKAVNNERVLRDVQGITRDIKMSGRITKLEYALATETSANVTPVYMETLSPAGYTTVGGATVAPISIVSDINNAPKDAALTYIIETIPE